jgi:hypothetical protein
MKIILTLGEISDSGNWYKYCNATGISEWCMNEGTANSSDEVALTIEEATQYGLVNFILNRLKHGSNE